MTRPGPCFWLTLGLLLASGHARADGFLLGKGGQYVPESAQQAFIEWAAGQEHLHVATRSEKKSDPALWIVPVPAPPDRVTAEPTETFPHVKFTQSVAEQARIKLNDWIGITLALDSGVPCLGLGLMGRNAKGTFRGDVEVHHRVEKFGMVVEVLTARSADGLDRYLNHRELDVRAADIKALEPYLQQEYTLICGWPANLGVPLTARSLQIDFPTPVVFYPLRPSRVYSSPIATTLFVRGWVQPGANLAIPGLRCRYLRGNVAETNIVGAPEEELQPWRVPPSNLEAVTRIDLPTSPAEWKDDLALVPGAPLAIRTAEIINHTPMFCLWSLSTALAGGLGSLLLWWQVPKSRRLWWDWLWALGAGLAMGFSIGFAAVVLVIWLRIRKLATPSPKSRQPTPSEGGGRTWADALLDFGGVPGLILIVLLLATVMVPFVLNVTLGSGMPESMSILGWITAIGLMTAMTAIGITLIYLTDEEYLGLLVILGICHFGLVLTIASCLQTWLQPYA